MVVELSVDSLTCDPSDLVLLAMERAAGKKRAIHDYLQGLVGIEKHQGDLSHFASVFKWGFGM